MSEAEWRGRAAAHRDRVRRWTGPHRERRRRGEPHPVHDFLFTYYSLRPGAAGRWHPGSGRGAAPGGTMPRAGAGTPPRRRPVRLDPAALPAGRGDTVGFVRGLLAATAARPPQLGCFGLHEWAMVYRDRRDPARHGAAAAGPGRHRRRASRRTGSTARTSTRSGSSPGRPRPRNAAAADPGRPAGAGAAGLPARRHGPLQVGLQAEPGDARRSWSPTASRWPSTIRELDMRATPYDLAALGYAPVAIETPEGKAEYVAAQRGFAARAAPLRARLLALCTTLPAAPVATITDPDRAG